MLWEKKFLFSPSKSVFPLVFSFAHFSRMASSAQILLLNFQTVMKVGSMEEKRWVSFIWFCNSLTIYDLVNLMPRQSSCQINLKSTDHRASKKGNLQEKLCGFKLENFQRRLLACIGNNTSISRIIIASCK